MILFFLTLVLSLLFLLKIFRINFSKKIITFIYVLFSINLVYLLNKIRYYEATDFYSYMVAFEKISQSTLANLSKVEYFEYGFRLLSWVFLNIYKNYTLDYQNLTFYSFFMIINIVFIFAFYFYFNEKLYSLLALYLYTYNPLFIDMSTNIIRQMLVISVIMLFFSLKKSMSLSTLLLPFIHFSSLPLILSNIFNKFISLKLIWGLFLIGLILFLFGYNEVLFGDVKILSSFNDKRYFEYYGGVGNRLDFLALTLFVCAIGSFTYIKKEISLIFYKYIILSASYFLYLGYQAFSERFAIYNWITLIFTLPLVLIIFFRKRENT